MKVNRVEYYGYGRSDVDAFMDAIIKPLNDIECENLTVDMMLECYVRDLKSLDNSYEEVTLKYSRAQHPKYGFCRRCTITRELL